MLALLFQFELHVYPPTENVTPLYWWWKSAVPESSVGVMNWTIWAAPLESSVLYKKKKFHLHAFHIRNNPSLCFPVE